MRADLALRLADQTRRPGSPARPCRSLAEKASATSRGPVSSAPAVRWAAPGKCSKLPARSCREIPSAKLENHTTLENPGRLGLGASVEPEAWGLKLSWNLPRLSGAVAGFGRVDLAHGKAT